MLKARATLRKSLILLASIDLTEGKSATTEEIRSNVGREEGGESLGEIDDKRMHCRGLELGQT